MEPWDIKRQRKEVMNQLVIKRERLSEALKDNDFVAYKINLSLCRNLSAKIHELTDLYEQAIDNEMKGWK